MGSSINICQETCMVNPQQRLQPIIFQDPKECRQSEPIADEQIQIKLSQSPLKVKNVKNVQNNFQMQSINKSVNQKLSKVNYMSMIIVGNKIGKQYLTDKVINVPYPVVKLTISEKLQKIMGIKPQVFNLYQQTNIASKWKLHKKGFYINYIAKDLYAIINNPVCYHGQLIEYNNQIVPDGKGILCTQEGMYEGQFKQGKAFGKGDYIDYENRTSFKGTWLDGYLSEGVIENQKFKYQGNFIRSEANGYGNIKFSENGEVYKGEFQNGLYAGKQCVLETKEYTYKGSFDNGKKNGYGHLKQKQRVYKKGKNKKYIPAQQYQGLWVEDVFQKRISKQQFSSFGQSIRPSSNKKMESIRQ